MTQHSHSTYRDLLSELSHRDLGRCHFDEPLSGHGSWQIGGPADLLIEPDRADKAAAIVRYTHDFNIPLVVIGQGTNLLFDDEGLRGVVLKLGHRFSQVTIEDNRIIADGGAWVPGLARKAMRAGLEGLEHIIGIPGTIGGLVMMNGGSQRKGIGSNVRRVQIVHRDGRRCVLSQSDCAFSYRQSALQASKSVVLLVELECNRGDPRQIRHLMIEDLRERRQKFPRKEPNCGSVFLSTSRMHRTVGPPGKIIEDSGLKGFRIGGAAVSRQHANFIVNRGAASAKDILKLIAHIRRTIKENIDFELDCEVRFVRSDGVILPAHLAEQKRESTFPQSEAYSN